MDKNYGRIELARGFAFLWMACSDGEISGFVEGADRRIVKGSNGWWRTNDAQKAARLAELLHVPQATGSA